MSDPRQDRNANRLPQTSLTDTVCTMSDFFKAYAQIIVLGISAVFSAILISIVLMFSLPPYLTWAAKQSIAKNEARGVAVLARSSKEAEIIVETAKMEATAMSILAAGQSNASLSKAESLRVLGEAARRYPEYAKDEYLLSLSRSINKGDIDSVLYVPTENNVPVR